MAPPSTASDLGQDAIDLAASAGLVLDPWQQTALRVGLAEAEDGRWAAFEVGVVVARQNGKDSIFEALQLAKLFLCGDELLIHSAHEFKTAKEAFRRVWELIDGDSELRARTLRRVLNPSEQGVDLRSGQRLRFFARTSGSGRGWTADTLILNEAYRLGGEQMAALLPTLSSRPNPQVWYGSSAALADSEQLHSVRARALAGDTSRLAYLEWSSPEDCHPGDPDAWAMANPSPRVPHEFIASEYEAMPLAQFRRERLSIPDAPLGSDAAVPFDKWQACGDPSSEIAGKVHVAIDGTWRQKTVIAFAGLREDGIPHVEAPIVSDGTDWVVPRMVELRGKWGITELSLDPSGPAGALIPALESAGFSVNTLSSRESAQACGAFYNAVAEGNLRHLGEDQWLNQAVIGARRRIVGDSWVWARRNSDVEIAPLVAATIALRAVLVPTEIDVSASVW